MYKLFKNNTKRKSERKKSTKKIEQQTIETKRGFLKRHYFDVV